MLKIKIKFIDQPLGFDSENNCYINALRRRYEVEFSDHPDFIFYSVFGKEFLSYPHSVRIFLANEPVIPNFNDCDYAIGSVPLSFGERYLRQPPLTGYGENLYWKQMREEPKINSNAFERKFCNFVYSNATQGDGSELRVNFCEALAGYKHIDCPGRVLNNMPNEIEQRYRKHTWDARSFNSNWAQSKLTFLQDYKFTIAFENNAIRGWTTEKLIHPFMAHSIPIYWGNPDVTEYFNPKAFINCADYGNDFEAVIQRVKELDHDHQQYMEMLRQPPLQEKFPYDWEDTLVDFLDALIKRGAAPFKKNPMGYESVSAQDFSAFCRTGKVGMRSIVKVSVDNLSGWLHYKMNHRRNRGRKK